MTPTEAAAVAAAHADHTAYVLPPHAYAIAQHLATVRTTVHFAAALWSIAVILFLLNTRVIARLRNVAVNLTKNRVGQGWIFFLLFLLLTTIFDLPFDIYRQHTALAYGLSVQHWGSWVGDAVKSFFLSYLVGGLLVMFLLWRIRRSPRTWWLQMWVGTCIFFILGIFITPYVIDPLFNRFEPLSQSNPALVAKLEQVVHRGKGIDIPPSRMFLMHASDKVTTLNAYVTGFGASKRVVVWDTSIAKGTPDQIAFIFGHEMGHYVLGHIVRGLLFGFALAFVFYLLSFYALRWLLARFGPAWRITDSGTSLNRIPAQQSPAVIAVLYLVILVMFLVAEPVFNTFSRAQEHAADVYGQEAVHGIVSDPQAVAQSAFNLLGLNGYSDPNPSALTVFWTYSHPAIPFRAAFAKHYDPWAAGAAPKYFAK